MADSEPRERFKFTTLLRQKIRDQKIQKYGAGSEKVPPPRLTYQQELKEMGKRNVQIKKQFELEKKGFIPSAWLFDPEADLMFHAKMSKAQNWNNLYNELLNKSRRLEKPVQTADHYVLARIYKYALFKTGREEVTPEFEKDYFTFQAVYQQRLDSQKMGDIESLCHQVFTHKDEILSSPQQPDILEQNGFKYNDATFDDLYVKTFSESIFNISTESSGEDEEQFEEEKGASKNFKAQQQKVGITKDDYIVEQQMTLSTSTQRRVVDRDLFNLDDTEGSSQPVEQEEQEPEIDIESQDPEKVNWFKYITDRYLQLQDEDGNETALQNADAYVNLLNMLLSAKPNEEIQEDLLNLVGFHNFEMLLKLIERREIIKDQCKTINEKLLADRQSENYKSKNMSTVPVMLSAQVEMRSVGAKKGKKRIPNPQQLENLKINNYEILKRLGFDRDFIDEQKRLGLQQQQLERRQNMNEYLMEEMERRKAAGSSNVFVKAEEKKNYQEVTEENDEFKYIQIIPPPKIPDKKSDLIAITELPPFARQAFGTTSHLNKIQSTVYQTAFKTSRSLLISAPTGAGKTNIALLTILREVSQHISEEDAGKPASWNMSLKNFKIIYIAPLKALASEIVDKFQKALAYLRIQVRELTGDMNMSKQEIQETHVIVSTPEKWDVVTRKSDGMMDMVNVMIIDEIHLLNDERGLVLECLVARAFMTSTKIQKPIRIVGLSATLPNYEDVAKFIGAEGPGTFYFDSSYRPTPLKCAFYGIKNLGNAQRANNIMNDIIYAELKRILRMGKQVIIFVHKRAETVSTAKELIEILVKKPHDRELFECERSYLSKSEVQRSRNEQVKLLFESGFSVHNAGLLRKDRNLVERMFMEGHIKVLVSTATLAWGVNLPAYAVIIKGTKMYDSATGTYKDIGVFDVQQIFGRAGRPQFDSEGEAIILTLIKEMDEYVKIMSNKQNIESNLFKGLDNCINAEISGGSIGTLTDGILWLKKTYYFQRVTKNPIAYGLQAKQIHDDPTAHFILYDKVTECVKRLNRMQLIRYNEKTETVYATDMGRIASNYYIVVDTMSFFMENLKPHTSDQRMMYFLAQSAEFKQLDARKEEHEELKRLIQDIRFFEVDKNCFNEASVKVLVLFEAYLRDLQLKTFSLISDMAYIVQNSARLLRAIFEIAMNKNFAELAKTALRWCQILDKRLKPTDHPLKQMTVSSFVGKLTNQNQKVTKYGYLNDEVAFRVQAHDVTLDQIYNHELDSIVTRALGPNGIDELYKFVAFIPNLELEVTVMPITRAILKVSLNITPNFEWSDRWNGKSEPFWVIVDNESEILHSEFFVLHKADIRKFKKGAKASQVKNESEINLTFFVPYEVQEGEKRIALGSNYNVSVLSDRWYDISFWQQIELSEIQVPDEDYPHTKLLNLRPLTVKALNNEKFAQLYESKGIKFFNPVQTQVFHTLFHTDSNVLIGAPTGSGKTIMSEFAMLRVFKNQPQSKIIYIAPLKALAKERIQDWKRRLQEGPIAKVVLELTGDVTPDLKALKSADVLITTPEKWDGISRNWQHRSYVQQVALVIIDEIHLLGQERGPVIEVIVSRMRYISEQTGNMVRFVGLSTALANAKDVADWLGIHKLGLYNFKPSVRPVPIKVFFEGFSEKHYCPRMATMNKPAYKAIMNHSKDNPVLIFVSSRRQTRLTALDLIALCAAESQDRYDSFQRPFLKMDPEEIFHISELLKDENLKQTINYGVGMHHAGLTENDRKIVEDLFVRKKIQVLVTTSTLAWGVNFPARLVIIKGTEFFDPKVRRYVDFPLTDLLQMIGRAGRPGFDETGYACVFVHEEKKNFYKKFLYEPFPVESSLQGQIVDHLNAEIASGTLLTRQNCIDYLTWTYFFRRLTKNPAYYKLKNNNANEINTFLRAMVNDSLSKLVNAGCIEYGSEDQTVSATTLGRLASFYYLSHETIQFMNEKIGKNDSIAQLISTLANAKEFFGLPVRHNEDVLNEALTHLVPLRVPKHDLENPHVKANLLIQAHLERCPLPITDYITDTKMVLDQSIRVLQGMIDVCTHKGHLRACLNLINLMQMIVQGQWLDQTPLQNVPNLDGATIRKLHNQGVDYLQQLVAKSRADPKKFFNGELKCNFDQRELSEVTKALERVPQIELRYSVVPIDDKNTPLENESLQEGAEAMIVVNLKRLNKADKQTALISHFPKPKDPGYFLIVSNSASDEIMAMKRVSFNRYATKSLSIALPEDFEREKLELYLMCDTYIGLDQQYTLDLNKINAVIKAKVRVQTNKKLSMNTTTEDFQPQSQVSGQIGGDKNEEVKGFSLFGNLKGMMFDDIETEEVKHRRGEGQRVNNEDDDENDDYEYDQDFERMIEKDLDNWI